MAECKHEQGAFISAVCEMCREDVITEYLAAYKARIRRDVLDEVERKAVNLPGRSQGFIYIDDLILLLRDLRGGGA